MGQRLTRKRVLSESPEEDDIPATATVQPLSLLLTPAEPKLGPIVVAGGVLPQARLLLPKYHCSIAATSTRYLKSEDNFDDIHLSTKSFECVQKPQKDPSMALYIKDCYPMISCSTRTQNGTTNSWLTFEHPGMKCQVAVTLQKSPGHAKLLKEDEWEVIIVQVFKSNEEVRSYGACKSPDSVDFTEHQYYKVDRSNCKCKNDKSCPCAAKKKSIAILDICDKESGCSKNPACCTQARQPLSKNPISTLNKGGLVFGKLCCKDMPNSSSRLSFHPKREKDPKLRTFFNRHSGTLRAETYYLNKIYRDSTIITYLAVYNTTTSEIYTPMAVEWYFRCTLCRTKGTDKFDFQTCATSSRQIPPKAFSLNMNYEQFPYIDPYVFCLQPDDDTDCHKSQDCHRYATFNNSIATYMKTGAT